MNKVEVSIGSNSRDRDERMAAAVEWLSLLLDDFRVSRIYETPEYYGRYDDYLNAVATGVTRCATPEELNGMLKEYERGSGRNREAKITGIVPIDIDIVVWNGDVLRPGEFGRSYFTIGYHDLQSR